MDEKTANVILVYDACLGHFQQQIYEWVNLAAGCPACPVDAMMRMAGEIGLMRARQKSCLEAAIKVRIQQAIVGQNAQIAAEEATLTARVQQMIRRQLVVEN